jgi:tetratricopeptide (TPR) repeat protein
VFSFLVTLIISAEPTTPKALFDEGSALYAKGEYAQAARRFEQAQKLKNHPSLWFNVGRCYEQLKEPGPALRAFRSYLFALPQAADRVAVEASVVKMHKLLQTKSQTQLVIRSTPVASVTVDGVERGTSPVFVELSSGVHQVALSADGFEKTERTVTVAIEKLPEATFELVPVVAAAVEAPVDIPLKPKTLAMRPALAASPPQVESALKPQQPPARRVATWVLAGTAVAAAGAGVGLMLGAQGASNELLARPHPRAEADALVARTQGFSLGSNIAYGVAGAAAVTAVILFFVEGGTTGPRAETLGATP